MDDWFWIVLTVNVIAVAAVAIVAIVAFDDWD